MMICPESYLLWRFWREGWIANKSFCPGPFRCQIAQQHLDFAVGWRSRRTPRGSLPPTSPSQRKMEGGATAHLQSHHISILNPSRLFENWGPPFLPCPHTLHPLPQHKQRAAHIRCTRRMLASQWTVTTLGRRRLGEERRNHWENAMTLMCFSEQRFDMMPSFAR